MYTARSMRAVLNRHDMRTFCITSPTVSDYEIIAEGTGGQVFNINQPFAEILNRFVSTMTSLYTATYQSNAELIPDSIEVEISLARNRLKARRRFAVLDIGRKLIVNNILFSTNQHTIQAQSLPELDYLVRLMKARPTLKVKIEGHTDNVGSEAHNMKLSYLRAEAVRQYMVKRGIARDRLYTIGYGATRPTASNDGEEGRQLNRRTEFIIVQK
jgi:outer membrane protein OmpA-like peptidoglycan-associated protein